MPPTEPAEPRFPTIGLNLAGGLVLALFAGLAAAWWEERRDPTIYSTSAIAQSSTVPVIAVLRSCTKPGEVSA
jgi:capsular polysaccharide biosynthesis protein